MQARLQTPGGSSLAHPAIYCTDLTRKEMPGGLAAADASRSPKRRDLSLAAVMERLEGGSATNPDADYLVRVNRALFM
jgi:hypothetical protein